MRWTIVCIKWHFFFLLLRIQRIFRFVYHLSILRQFWSFTCMCSLSKLKLRHLCVMRDACALRSTISYLFFVLCLSLRRSYKIEYAPTRAGRQKRLILIFIVYMTNDHHRWQRRQRRQRMMMMMILCI